MNEIRLRGYRCFRDAQTARLAPLTLLVGENSTGKTSFLALVRALWDLGRRHELPNFKEPPYDLGSFDEIAHHRGARGSRATTFEAGFTEPVARTKRRRTGNDTVYDFTFSRDRNQPALARRRIGQGDTFVEVALRGAGPAGTVHGPGTEPHPADADGSQITEVFVGTGQAHWSRKLVSSGTLDTPFREQQILIPFRFLLGNLLHGTLVDTESQMAWTSKDWPRLPSEEERQRLQGFVGNVDRIRHGGRPYASAPVRSKPRRTYDPARVDQDPEGETIPMYLADVAHRSRRRWLDLRRALEEFGRASGLFDEMRVRRLGKTSGEPFQIQVRKSGTPRLKGPWRNLTDVGYGVSQVLPVITELLRSETPGPELYLLQQPEVHLHPSAQAALGSLFCRAAAHGRQLIVETHGDYLIDRVRMDVRDGTAGLEPRDVSILFFERAELEVTIHSLTIDEAGNIQGAPPSYRRFFVDETNRSIGL